ncbi:tetratricopeptide repeat protein [Undibacterium fentianense]|uniref:Tetratricopeptide repeat protein n=1 Tax=Undibacterium fentianense TaxID=2828728 RepID=A0A941E0F6_9BURK|nr:tetratricopeptide repeat protein [Undibacterium fentianense]MBR7800140.1 tetratricopeptide repeat protein [Undibacterium fentianense]
MAIPSTKVAAPISFTDRKILVIDDMPDMRTTMRNQMQALGIMNVSLASNVREALSYISQRTYDVILCDYYLGGSTDGQQFLEYLRTSNAISRATLFIMITAETGFNSVITAAECMPDDYLLKPFTGETLKIRLERLLERKARLAAIDRLQDQGAWPEIIKACDDIIASKDKYVVDAMRIKGNALLMLQQTEQAINFYQNALKMRDMPWAKLGLARALKFKGEDEQASHLLENIIDDNPRLLAAYDLLGKIHSDAGDAEKALHVLDNACKIAPHSLARQRSIASLAESTGDYERVDKALSVVVKQTRNSPLRDPIDFAKLTNALTETGELERAVDVLKEAKEHFKENAEVKMLAAYEAVAQSHLGNKELAKKALDLALADDGDNLSEASKLALAKACLAQNRAEEAREILKSVVQNNPDSNKVQAEIASIYKDHGGDEIAQHLIESSVKEVINLNNEAVQKARAGHYAEASSMLTEAALRLPNNLQIVSNAALSILMDIFTNGYDSEKSIRAKQFQDAVFKQNNLYPKLAEINAFQIKIQAKYKLEIKA